MSDASTPEPAPSRAIGLIVFAVTLLAVFAAVEWISRSLIPRGHFVWPPGFEITFDAGEVIAHGVEFPATLSINDIGMRGDLPTDTNRYRVLAVGGSTTICVYLDDAVTWPFLLQKRLRDALGPDAAWVGNAGRPGHKTDHHILQVEALLDEHPGIDRVVLLLGFNDFVPYLTTLTHPQWSIQPSDRDLKVMAFSLFPGWDADTPWYRRNFIGRALSRLDWTPLPGTEEMRPMDEKGVFQSRLRGYRQRAGRFVDTLPELTGGLSAYVANVKRIVAIADARGAEVLLLTQPTLWRDDLQPDERSLLWGGGPPFFALSDGADYYSASALAEGMALYNEALLRLCADDRARCLDVAAAIPRTTDFFFDDAHFTEKGSAAMATLIADHLLAHRRPDDTGDTPESH